MAEDITRIIRSLQTAAVGRCKKRLDAAAQKARGLIPRDDDTTGKDPARTDEHGVTSVLKRRYGL
jgi:hypothetical protein